MKSKYSNKYILETGIGLQDVDKLKNSNYFLCESEKYIKGEISLEELDATINSYYAHKAGEEERNEEADKVSIRIAQIIADDSFTFTVGQLLSIHKRLFDGLLYKPGTLRTYNFTKKEWVLDGASVTYGDFRELEMTLQYDFDQERNYRYNNLSKKEIIAHLASFIANLWQIHPFEEGNTRTAAVFFIKYLRSLGFDVTNDTFAKNSWYFRNSLVRANYTNINKGIYEDKTFLIKFLENLLDGKHNQLKNRELHINEDKLTDISSRESRIVDLIKSNPNITVETIAENLEVSSRTIKSVLKSMQDKGIIKRENGKKYGYWKIK